MLFEMAFDGNCQVCKQPIQSRCFTIISLDAFSNWKRKKLSTCDSATLVVGL